MAKQKKEVLRYIAMIIAIVIIILSIFDMFNSFNGYAINFGLVNVSIESFVSINFSIDEINFGPGSLLSGFSNATLDTLGNVTGGNWTPVYNGFRIDNIGNVNVTLNLLSNKTAQEFIGGNDAQLKYLVTNIYRNSCVNNSIALGRFYDVNTTYPGTLICSQFSSSPGNNSIRVDLMLVIPFDANIGEQYDIFTATATAS